MTNKFEITFKSFTLKYSILDLGKNINQGHFLSKDWTKLFFNQLLDELEFCKDPALGPKKLAKSLERHKKHIRRWRWNKRTHYTRGDTETRHQFKQENQEFGQNKDTKVLLRHPCNSIAWCWSQCCSSTYITSLFYYKELKCEYLRDAFILLSLLEWEIYDVKMIRLVIRTRLFRPGALSDISNIAYSKMSTGL